MRVYQPLSGLHRPVVVDPQLPNFQDLRLTLRCVPGELLNPQEAGVLCQKVGLLFENQGALVTMGDEDEEEEEEEGEEGSEPEEEPPMDLTLELSAREIDQANNLLSWVICLGTFTVLPAVTESTFAQEVVIRDSTGSLLVSESLEGRIVERFGAGTWLGNKFLDLVWRDDDDKLTGDIANRDLSTDLYRQISQLMFNAKMQSQVLESR